MVHFTLVSFHFESVLERPRVENQIRVIVSTLLMHDDALTIGYWRQQDCRFYRFQKTIHTIKPKTHKTLTMHKHIFPTSVFAVFRLYNGHLRRA